MATKEHHIHKPELSIILPVHNGEKVVERQIDSILQQECSFSWELLLVDNTSTDNTALVFARYAQQYPSKVRIVQASHMANLSYARNTGVDEAQGESVLFVDADDLVGKNWLQPLAIALQDHQLVAPQMEYQKLNTFKQLYLRAEFQHEGIETLFSIPVVNGVGGWRKKLWQELGGNEEKFYAGGEDFDISIRAYKEKDIAPYFVSDAVYHVSFRDTVRDSYRQARRNAVALAFLFRLYGSSQHISVLRYCKKWVWALIHFWYLLSPKYRIGWAQYVGRLVGCMRGSWRFKVRYFT